MCFVHFCPNKDPFCWRDLIAGISTFAAPWSVSSPVSTTSQAKLGSSSEPKGPTAARRIITWPRGGWPVAVYWRWMNCGMGDLGRTSGRTSPLDVPGFKWSNLGTLDRPVMGEIWGFLALDWWCCDLIAGNSGFFMESHGINIAYND